MASSPIVAGYWRSSKFDSLPPCNIKFEVFTHLFYSFVQVDPSSEYKLKLTDDDERMLHAFSVAAHDNSVKALLSIGGDSSVFAALAADPDSRASFIQSTIKVGKQFQLDGFDLDWEFPNNNEAMKNLGNLVEEWRGAMDTGCLLTAAVWFKPTYWLEEYPSDVHLYPIEKMEKALDWINVMAYNLPGSQNPYATMLHAPLYDSNRMGNSVSDGVEAWIAAKMPKAKIVLGMPLYARTWLLTDPDHNEVGAKAKGFGPGPMPAGVLSYSKVKQFNRYNYASVKQDKNWGEEYSYAGTTWLGYDDDWTVKKKVEYAQTLKVDGIAGSFLWSIDQDDDAFHLATTVWNVWHALGDKKININLMK